jgi:FkbM family methyltransferase
MPKSGNGPWSSGATVIRRAAALVGVDRTALPSPISEGGPFEQVETDVGPLWIQTGDEVMRPYLARRKSWKESTGTLLDKLLAPGARFLDVGAHVGYFSLFASSLQRGIEIDAVEPHPISHSLLQANLWANKVSARVHHTALGTTTHLASMSSAPMNTGDFRVDIVNPDNRYDLLVPVVRGDELFPRRTFDVVKIHVQGYELDVVLGMERIVRHSPAIALVVAFWPSALIDRGLDPSHVLANYERLGYHIAVNDPKGTGACAADEVIEHCQSAGPNGQVNLVLSRNT